MTERSRRLYKKLFTYTTCTAIKVHVHVDTPLKVILKKRSQLTSPLPPPNHPTFHYNKKLGGDQGIGLDQKQELWYDKERSQSRLTIGGSGISTLHPPSL